MYAVGGGFGEYYDGESYQEPVASRLSNITQQCIPNHTEVILLTEISWFKAATTIRQLTPVSSLPQSPRAPSTITIPHTRVDLPLHSSKVHKS